MEEFAETVPPADVPLVELRLESMESMEKTLQSLSRSHRVQLLMLQMTQLPEVRLTLRPDEH